MGQMKYIDKDAATVEQLQPGIRLYLDTGSLKCVARIGQADDWAAYIAFCAENWTLDNVAEHGFKLHENQASKIFPICLEAGLHYRH